MNRVTIDIVGNETFRSSEIVADLRNVSEILYLPLRCVAFWDVQTSGHICPNLLAKTDCPHQLDSNLDSLSSYRVTARDKLKSIVEIYFPHAEVYIYLR